MSPFHFFADHVEEHEAKHKDIVQEDLVVFSLSQVIQAMFGSIPSSKWSRHFQAIHGKMT